MVWKNFRLVGWCSYPSTGSLVWLYEMTTTCYISLLFGISIRTLTLTPGSLTHPRSLGLSQDSFFPNNEEAEDIHHCLTPLGLSAVSSSTLSSSPIARTIPTPILFPHLSAISNYNIVSPSNCDMSILAWAFVVV